MVWKRDSNFDPVHDDPAAKDREIAALREDLRKIAESTTPHAIPLRELARAALVGSPAPDPAAKDREIEDLQASLEFEHEETKRLRDIIADLRGLSGSPAPDDDDCRIDERGQDVGYSGTEAPRAPWAVEMEAWQEAEDKRIAALSGSPAPDPAEAMRDLEVFMQSNAALTYEVLSLRAEIAAWKERAMQAAELMELRAEAMRAKCEAIIREIGHDWWADCEYRKSDACDYLADRIAALKGNGEGK